MSYSEENGQVVLRMSREEKSNERQVAYSAILDAVRGMKGRRTPSKILAEINKIANADDAWKALHGLNSGNPNYTPYQVESDVRKS